MAARPLLIGALGAGLLLSACGPAKPTAPAAVAAPAAGRLQVQRQTVADLKPVPATLTTRDIADARDKIQKESDELLNRLVKAHGIDPAKYRLDPQAQAFVPIPAPAAPKQSPAK